MIRTAKDAIVAYVNASETERALMLVRLSYDLTITARDLHSSADVTKRDRIPGLSEIQHIALGQALAIFSRSPYRYPDAEMIPVLVKTAERFGLANYVQESISKYLEQSKVDPS